MKIKIYKHSSFLKQFLLFFSVFFIGFSFISSIEATELADVVEFRVNEISSTKNQVAIQLVTKNDFKIYQENLSFDLYVPGKFPEKLSYTANPQAEKIFDPFSNQEKYIFKNGTILFLSSQTLVQPGNIVKISVQACSVDVCLLPSTLDLKVNVNSKSSPVSAQNSISNFSSTSQESSSEKTLNRSETSQTLISSQEKSPINFTQTIFNFLKTGSVFLFPLLFLAGLLTNLTPCVYPMIPITLSVMSQFGKNQKSPFMLALIYTLGMVLTYSLLGVGAAMTGQVFGSQLASPLLNGVVACIMIVLGFAMLDFFDLSILQRLSYKIPFSNKSPVLAVGTMGAVSGLVAAPCTGPILSMILVLIAQTREPITGFIYMLFFALGFGAPYVALGVLSQKITKLPKMHTLSGLIKILFACLMFALALYFLKSTLASIKLISIIYLKPDFPTVFVVIIILLIFFGIKKPRINFIKYISKTGVILSFTLLCLWLTLFLSNSFLSSQSLNTSKIFDEVIQNNGIKWETNLKSAAQHAKKTDKKILVDVWAEWCAACLEMESTTWQDPKVINLISDSYIAVKLDYTHPTEEISELLSQWNVLGLPAVLVFDPKDLKNSLKINQGLISTKELIMHLNETK